MIIVLTGETGSGKTDTCWALVSAMKEIVFLDCDWFASRSPFSWGCEADVASVYRAVFSQIGFHLSEGRRNFVMTLTHEMALTYWEHVSELECFALPIRAFRLVPRYHVVRQRIVERDRDQVDTEIMNAQRQREALDNAFINDSNFVAIDNTDLTAQQAANLIISLAER